jgi:hypothetical protein
LNRRKKGKKTKQKKGRKPAEEGGKPLNPFLKPFKIKRYEPKPFFSCSYDLETKRKKETLSKWPRIFALVVKGKKLDYEERRK